MLKYEFRCRASQWEQAAFWKVKVMFELWLRRPAAFPGGRRCPPSRRAAAPSGATTLPPATSETQNQVSPSLTEAFALENAYFVCDNAN